MGFLDRVRKAARDAQWSSYEDGEEMSPEMRVYRLGQVGVESPATIRALGPTGRTDGLGGQEHRFEVTVEPEDGAPYDAAFTQSVHPDSLGAWATPGARVTVKADPDDPRSLILWGGLN